MLIISSIFVGSELAQALPRRISPPQPDPIALKYGKRPLEINLLTDTKLAKSRRDVITANSMSTEGHTQPSLWWTSEQLPNKLVTNWLAYPQQKQIDVIVNPQFWNILEYPERYQLINTWGTVARRHGFDVRIFNLRFSDREPIVVYTCNRHLDNQRCVVQWQSSNQNSLTVKSIVR